MQVQLVYSMKEIDELNRANGQKSPTASALNDSALV
jgi:hypothetical protein